MPAYVVVTVRSVSPGDAARDALLEYRRRNTDAVAAHGGRFLVRGGAIEPLETEGEQPVRVVVIEFPETAAARGWYESEQYAPLRELRRSVSVTDILIADGV